MNAFKATGNAIVSVMNTVVAITKLAEDTVQLAANEVTALEQAQQIRLDEVKDERQTLIDTRNTAKVEAGTHEWNGETLVRKSKSTD